MSPFLCKSWVMMQFDLQSSEQQQQKQWFKEATYKVTLKKKIYVNLGHTGINVSELGGIWNAPSVEMCTVIRWISIYIS